MNLSDIGNAIRRNTRAHGSIALSISAGAGVIATAYLSGRASFKAAELIREDEEENPPYYDSRARFKGRVKLVWRFYIPTAISGATTIACVIGSNRLEANKALAAQTAFAVVERAYSDYRDKVIEEFGDRGPAKDKAFRDQIALDRVTEHPPAAEPHILVTGPGNVLCCELYTGRYFACDMETLRKAQNTINHKVNAHDYAMMADFYWEVKLPLTTVSSQLGWRAGRLMELDFTSVLTDDGRPCLAFDYNYVATL